MKMNKTIAATAVAIATVLPATAMAAPSVTLSGVVGGKVVMPMSDDETKDWKFSASKARMKLKAVDATSLGKAIAEIEVDFDDLANSKNADGEAVDVRTARVLLINKAGTFVAIGRGASGQFSNLVGPVDRFKNGGANFFSQGSRSSNVLAYVTPEIAGGLKLVVAGVASGTSNSEDLDATVLRAQYKFKGIKAAAGVVSFPNDSSRVGLGLSGQAGPVNLGLAYEANDSRADDKSVLGVAGTMKVGESGSVSVGVNTVMEVADGSALTDAMAYQVLYAHKLSKQTSMWAEYDGFNDEAAMDGALAVGMDVKF